MPGHAFLSCCPPNLLHIITKITSGSIVINIFNIIDIYSHAKCLRGKHYRSSPIAKFIKRFVFCCVKDFLTEFLQISSCINSYF